MKLSFSKIYEESVKKKKGMCCPDCKNEGSLKYADDEVLVCDICKYSIEAEELQPVWQEIIEEESGFYDYEESDFVNE